MPKPRRQRAPKAPPAKAGGGERIRRRAYSRPVLQPFGSLTDVTLAGVSPGTGDSLFPTTKP